MKNLLLGAAAGIALTLCAVNLLFGAQGSMVSSSGGWDHEGARYIVGKKRFDYFGKSGPNCWGGHTLDGRCISAVYVSSDPNYLKWWNCDPIRAYPLKCEAYEKHLAERRERSECASPHKCDDHGFLMASPEAKRKVATSCPSANPLYVEKYGRCPR